jgi:hypothetical protein
MKISISYLKIFATTYKFVSEMKCINDLDFNFISKYIIKKRKDI